jgi:hypothetical protein
MHGTQHIIPLKLCLFLVLLHMDMNRYILHIQEHTLLHSWTLDVTHGSTTHQDARILPSHWLNSHSWARVSSLLWLHDLTQTHHIPLGLLWTSDQPNAKTCTWQYTTLTRGRHNWFMTRHSAPGAIKMHMAITVPLRWCVENKNPSGSDCPGLSSVTTNGWTWSLGKPNKVQNLQVSSASVATNCY